VEIVTFSFLAILFGVRHGMDADHIAAIADMVGAENERKRQVRLGLMYAIGHGLIVLVIGVVAIFIGAQLPEAILTILEIIVGATLILLGGMILYTMLQAKNNYEYKSRISMVYQVVVHSFRKLNPTEKNKEQKVSPVTIGVTGALIIGIIHGLGVETPTQVAVITTAVGVNNLTVSIMHLLLFVVGLLLSTTLITLLASWGFMKSKYKKILFYCLGSITGIYSIGLGIWIIYGV
jgi:high-affinity nickel permease